MLILYSLMLILSLMLMSLNHPISISAVLLVQTILISITSGLLNHTFWFSYIIFIIMVGGLMIIFMYMTSIASNEKFKINYKMIFILTPISSIFLMNMQNQWYSTHMINNYLTLMKNYPFYMHFIKYFSFPMMLTTIGLTIFLFFIMVASIKIVAISQGPLRQKF
uniref:NADH dehydrogenase subunit 6 n=1 Tax=Cucujoidea sp. 34 KM-2017 TaxID=2219372 RepID=A0A346RHQ4_9CUCU|nr:NADH dehydrogenase subunit 6 [Cucujoidea sp. 34 KM-2017]